MISVSLLTAVIFTNPPWPAAYISDCSTVSMAELVLPAAAPGQAAQLGCFWQPRALAWGLEPLPQCRGELGCWACVLLSCGSPLPSAPLALGAGSSSSLKYPKGKKGLMLLACELERCIIHCVQRQERERRCLAKPPEWLIYP